MLLLKQRWSEQAVNKREDGRDNNQGDEDEKQSRNRYRRQITVHIPPPHRSPPLGWSGVSHATNCLTEWTVRNMGRCRGGGRDGWMDKNV